MTSTFGSPPPPTPVDPCDRCGQVHQRCAGHRSTGDPCGRWPTHGTTVCAKHGAQLPRVRARAAAAEVEAQAARAVVGLSDAAPVTDVLGELAKLAGEVLAWKRVCAARLESLGDAIRYTADGAGTEQLRAEVAVFERSLDRCERVLSAIARLDIDSRLARISEQQAAVIARAVEVALAAAGVAGEPADRGRAAAARELRAAS